MPKDELPKLDIPNPLNPTPAWNGLLLGVVLVSFCKGNSLKKIDVEKMYTYFDLFLSRGRF